MLAVLLPLAAVIAIYFARSLSDFPKGQRITSLFIRLCFVVLLVLALSGLTFLRSTDELYVIFLADHSLSIGDDGSTVANDFLTATQAAQGSNEVVALPFAATAGQVQQDLSAYLGSSNEPKVTTTSAGNDDTRGSGGNEQTSSLASKAQREGTDLAAAIETAAGYAPPGYVPRIVLMSDGNQTSGDGLRAASRSRVPVYTVPLPTRSEPEVQVSAVKVPAEVREGEPFYVDVTIHSNHDDEGLVEVFRGDHKVIGERRRFKTGENRWRFEQSIDRDRLAAFTVRVSGLNEDTLLDNNADSGLVYAAGKPRVLIVESDPNLIRELAYALEDEGIQADIRPPQGMPDNLADMQNYECVLISNVPATDLTSKQMRVARSYVQDLGGGLIMLGGEQSFGLGGYYKSAIEEILPVRSDLEKEKEKP